MEVGDNGKLWVQYLSSHIIMCSTPSLLEVSRLGKRCHPTEVPIPVGYLRLLDLAVSDNPSCSGVPKGMHTNKINTAQQIINLMREGSLQRS